MQSPALQSFDCNPAAFHDSSGEGCALEESDASAVSQTAVVLAAEHSSSSDAVELVAGSHLQSDASMSAMSNEIVGIELAAVCHV